MFRYGDILARARQQSQQPKKSHTKVYIGIAVIFTGFLVGLIGYWYTGALGEQLYTDLGIAAPVLWPVLVLQYVILRIIFIIVAAIMMLVGTYIAVK
jgi:hypothetical protein